VTSPAKFRLVLAELRDVLAILLVGFLLGSAAVAL
jgi:hypothetical protein